MTDTYTKSPDEAIAEILDRFSVTDLIEQTNEDLDRADELFYRSGKAIQIVEQGEQNLMKWWIIRSGDKTYQVRRFKNFCFCSCKDFFFRKRACRHISITTGVYCENCRVSAAKVGKLCYSCDVNANFLGKPQEKNDEQQRISS